ncbi:MAG: three-Cys-motif partner protein TcmP [Sporolactobacillus sp.]|jgi:three-Cys-motif partner protein|nr:three-Cys-motif partner protein TcmP [Sporolactobacillus sp.]
MSKISSAKWKIEPHTQAKHAILKTYLQAWIPMMTLGYNYSHRAILIDGFAGPGEYENGEKGSPIIMLETAITYMSQFPEVHPNLVFVFIEKDEGRYSNLLEKIKEEFHNDVIRKSKNLLVPNGYDYIKILAFNDSFENVMRKILNSVQGNMAPCFTFVDPFGFKDTPFYLIRKLSENNRSEIFINFMYEFINRFLKLPELQDIYSQLFGTDKWKYIVGNLDKFSSKDRRFFIHKLYELQLKKTGFDYVSSFELKNKNNATKYFLYHGTKHLKGLEKMKDAMWKIDGSGSFTFSDYEANQTQLSFIDFDKPDLNILAKLLINKFHGQTVNCGEVKNFILTDTPFRRQRHPKQAFDILKKQGNLEITNRKRGGYPDYATLKFK